MSIESKSMHITHVGGNVFADLGFEPEDAAALKAESQRIISEKLNDAGKRTKDAGELRPRSEGISGPQASDSRPPRAAAGG